MCLLVTQTAGVVFDAELLQEIYYRNSDGIGVVFTNEHGEVEVHKLVPANERDFLEFYGQWIAGRECAWHARMRTHGHTDLTNCHPYPISLPDGSVAWLMHNGILSHGNKADTSKSDTWHYIEDTIKPMLAESPGVAHTAAFRRLVEQDIGASNKFVLVTPDGRSTTFNEAAGELWVRPDGTCWMSNTYAWPAEEHLSWLRPRKSDWMTKSWPGVTDKADNYYEAKSCPSHTSGVDAWIDFFTEACEDDNLTMEFDDETLALAYYADPDAAEDFLDEMLSNMKTSREVEQWVIRQATACVDTETMEDSIGPMELIARMQ